MDLSKVTFPTFVLEPRSMLERITDFMAHPDLIFECVPLLRVIPQPDLRTCTLHGDINGVVPPAPLLGTGVPSCCVSFLHTLRKMADDLICDPSVAPTCAKTLRTGSSACSNIISQGGISNPRASRSREPYPLPLYRRIPFSHTRAFCHVDIIPSWANSSDADMTIRTVRRDFTSQNKVRISPPFPTPPLISDMLFFCSFASSTYIRFLLRFAGKQGRRCRRAPAKVQVPR